MPSIKSIKQRIKSTKNTSQITKAMEVVSATKMRKSQGFAIVARPFAMASLEMLENLLTRTPELPPLLQNRVIEKSALLIVTSDKGLAGAFNANVLRKAEQWIEVKKNENKPFTLITVGKKAKEYFDRRNTPITRSYWGFGDYSTLEQTLPVADSILNGFSLREFDEVEAIYTNFRTTLSQEAILKKLLPVTREGIREAVESILPIHGRYSKSRIKKQELRTKYTYEYQLEPSPTEILEALIPQLLRMHVHHMILESNASEHSARMVAMKNASDNAKELISDLSLEYNKARQAGITRELIEITAGREALEN